MPFYEEMGLRQCIFDDFSKWSIPICPAGYIEKSGDIVGPGIYYHVKSIDECAHQCSITPDCCVFEYSSSKHDCQLHKKCVPDYLGPDPNYVFCQSSKYISINTGCLIWIRDFFLKSNLKRQMYNKNPQNIQLMIYIFIYDFSSNM